jgi:hypothetical protein
VKRQYGERGAALILLLGITATLTILTAALVMLLANEQGASASSRESKTSLYYAEAALDSGVNAVKLTTSSGMNFATVSPGIDTSLTSVQTQLNTQYAVACPLPAPTPTYNVYDNASPVVTTTHWDANLDHKLWVEARVKYLGHWSVVRQMLDSSTATSILPEAALYADTSIVANGTSDIYAVKPDGTFYTPDNVVTSIMAGDDFTGNSATNLAPPTGSARSLGINVNGTVTLPAIPVAQQGPNPKSVGLLSDYFDQARQYALTVEAQSAISGFAGLFTDTSAPAVPSVPTTTVASTQFTPANLTTAYLTSIGASFNSGTKTYTFGTDLRVTGNLALNATTFPTGTIFNFQKLYVASGTFTVTSNVTVSATTLYVGGALTISGANTAITDNLGTLYTTGSATISGTTALTTASASTSYVGGNFSHTGPSTAITDNLGPLYVVGNATFSANVNVSGKAVHTGGGLSITAPTASGTTVADNFTSVWVVGTLAISGNAVMDTTSVYTGANFTIAGNTAALTDQFGPIYVTGTADWNSGSMSVRLGIQTTTQADPTTANPMFAQIFTIDGDTNGNYDSSSGPYDVVLGDVWVDGNAGTGNVAVNFSAPSQSSSPQACTIMCPLLATTEKTATNGYVNMGTLTDPMVYYMQCDNDGLYSNTCIWASTGTFTGLAVVMEAALQITGGNDTLHPNFVGSVLAGTPVSPDITMSSNSTVCYNQAAIENLPPNLQSILRTSTTQTVPGTWQQITAN